jgi:N-acetylmuramoyl-L-alanine amidase
MSQRNLFIGFSTIVSSIATAVMISGAPAPQAAMAEVPSTTPTAAPSAAPPSVAPSVAPGAAAFSQQEIDTNKVIAVASPYGEGEHQLLVLQQVSEAKPCWNVKGNDVKTVDPLLLEFDFTGICSRATDSNGYSIRMAGQDVGWRYSLQVTQRQGETLLIGRPTGSKKMPEITIARIKGTPEGFGKFEMEPGWRIAKRTFNGEALGHFYFTHDQTLTALSTPAISLK